VSLPLRKEISVLANADLDLLVIGGGIVGAGIARDAAMRGLKTGLIDAHDFAFGTSSRSSRLLHGGIRYLAQGRVKLVREASIEKTILHKIAPHLAQPLAFIFPAYRGSGWPFWQLRIGVHIYDLLAGQNLGRSEALNLSRLSESAPQLTQQNLKGAVRYFDGFTNDARLVLDTLRSAQNAGALLANFARFQQVTGSAKNFTCEITDELTNTLVPIRTRAVANATGPWAQNLGYSQVQLRLTKGIHLIFDSKRLPTTDAIVITEGKRILFVLPWGERTIVGTTDTDFDGPPEFVSVEREDVEYLLATVNRFFPTAKLRDDDILSRYAGLRPLVADSKGRPSDISRSHVIRQPQPGWWDIAGGKLTTYRLMAEQTVDQITRHLAGIFQPCRTATTPLLPASETTGISQITPPEVSRGLVRHFCKNEFALHLDDVMIRRTSWRYYLPNSAEIAKEVAAWMQEFFNWTDARTQEELSRYRHE
jgi:glycerol-3-phosphate dehydrogenase